MRTSLLLAALTATFAASSAQAQTGFMPYLGYNTNEEQFYIGVGARLGTIVSAPIAIAFQPSIEVGLEDDEVIQVDANGVASLGYGAVAPYAGAGVGVVFYDSGADTETEIGLNVLGGLMFNNTGFAQPFVEGRYSTRGGFPDAFTAKAGVLFSF